MQTLRYGIDPHGLFASAHRAHGDVFTLRVMAETWVVLAHPDAVREVYARGPDDVDSAITRRVNTSPCARCADAKSPCGSTP